MKDGMNVSTKVETVNASVEAETSSNLDNNHFYGINSGYSQMIMYDRKHPTLANKLAFEEPGSGRAFCAKAETTETLTEAEGKV